MQFRHDFSQQKWWKKTLTSLNRERHYSTTLEAQEDDNDDFERQGVHPFYESVIPDAYLNTVSLKL